MRKTNKINIRVFYDGTAEAKDVFSDAIAARVVRARDEKPLRRIRRQGIVKAGFVTNHTLRSDCAGEDYDTNRNEP